MGHSPSSRRLYNHSLLIASRKPEMVWTSCLDLQSLTLPYLSSVPFHRVPDHDLSFCSQRHASYGLKFSYSFRRLCTFSLATPLVLCLQNVRNAHSPSNPALRCTCFEKRLTIWTWPIYGSWLHVLTLYIRPFPTPHPFQILACKLFRVETCFFYLFGKCFGKHYAYWRCNNNELIGGNIESMSEALWTLKMQMPLVAS